MIFGNFCGKIPKVDFQKLSSCNGAIVYRQPEAGPPMAELGSNMHYVYIIQSLAKNWKYIGSTDNIGRRLMMHNSGATKSTKAHRPLKLLYSESFDTKTEALKREIFLKKNFKAREEIYNKIQL